uniref:Molybdopterin biosynthesis protein, putative n=1 Tax=Arundo donax TaxID=35708 RepID=A0A0A9HB93_ARUDO
MEARKGGSGSGARTSSARTRPSASCSGTSRGAAWPAAADSTAASASSTGSISPALPIFFLPFPPSLTNFPRLALQPPAAGRRLKAYLYRLAADSARLRCAAV